MTSEVLLREAWGRLPAAGLSVDSAGRFTAARMERIIQILVAVGALVVGGQSFVVSLDLHGVGPLHDVLHTVIFVALAAMIVCCVAGYRARTAAAVFAWLFPAVLLLWPLAAAGAEPNPGAQPWTFYLINVATVGGIVAFPLPWQFVWAAAMSLLYAVIRLARGEFASEFWVGTGYDVSVALIQGGVFVTVAWVLRSLASGVDAARAQAVLAYARAASTDAAEKERVAVAALMHDSVLAALIAAERAQTPREKELAVSMAREALTRLANAESDDPEGSDEPMSRADIAHGIERSAADMGVSLRVGLEGGADGRVVPGRVARAVVLAAAQAIANAVQHAGGAGLAVRVARAGRGVRVEVSDSGPGVDVASIPADRLGIRASIFARMAAAGGEATIVSGARGTTVTLTWTGETPVRTAP